MMMAIPHGTAEQAKFKAYAAFSTGDFSSAIRHFSKAMSVGPSNYLLYSNQSATYAILGKYSEALVDAVKPFNSSLAGPRATSGLTRLISAWATSTKLLRHIRKALSATPMTKVLKSA